jgi:class 3 adenylate cyclase
VLGVKAAVALRPAHDGPRELALDLSAPPPAQLKFRPGAVTLRLAGGATDALARVELEAWKQKGATAAIVTTLQDFRDLFSSEVLAPGVEVGVQNIGLLFTDLKDSTALYEKIGDATAYALVRDHFTYLFAIIRRRDGAVIKTIGDAVMAAFSRPSDALEAALEMQERVRELNAALAPKPPVILKIGVHAGPAIAINTDGVLDYFGTTVNLAARVQNESRGGDVVISEPLFHDARCKDALGRHAASVETATVRLKGLTDAYELRRLTPRA